MHTDQILGIIPARYASTRFPGKPLADLGGKSMIRRVVQSASAVLSHVLVATDDDRIRSEVESFGGQVVMTDPLHASGTDRCAEALQIVSESSLTKFNVVVNIQGDEPFLRPDQLQAVCDSFDDENVDIATLIKPIETREIIFDPNRPKVVIDNRGFALYFSRSPIPYLRDVPDADWHSRHTYFQHIGLYAYRTGVLRKITSLPQSILERAESLEQLRWLGNGYRIKAIETAYESFGIDTPEDLERARRNGLFT